MLNHISVVPLAAESFGVRSMCTYVETSDVRMLLDAGVSVCPIRFGLPPHPQEFRAIDRCRKAIAEAAARAKIVTISHYHFDHHTPSYEDWLCNWTAANETAKQIYSGKIVLLKNPRENINASQRQRAWMFQQTGGKYAKEMLVADGNAWIFGDTRIRFSTPVPHGSEGSGLGFVLMAIVECQDEMFMFAPDVQGPMAASTLELILNEKPQLLMVGGPPSYLADFKVDNRQIQVGLKNLEKIVERVPVVLLEHHFLRDLTWREKASALFRRAKKADTRIMTSAEFLGQPESFLEAFRKQLFNEDKPSTGFEKWMRGSEYARRLTKPPI